MCVQFNGVWHETIKTEYGLKAVRVFKRNKNKDEVYVSLFDPEKRIPQDPHKIYTGENLRYELKSCYTDNGSYGGSYGFYLYPMSLLEELMEQYDLNPYTNYDESYFSLLLVRIPSGTLIRYGKDLNGRKTINTKVLVPLVSLINKD